MDDARHEAEALKRLVACWMLLSGALIEFYARRYGYAAAEMRRLSAKTRAATSTIAYGSAGAPGLCGKLPLWLGTLSFLSPTTWCSLSAAKRGTRSSPASCCSRISCRFPTSSFRCRSPGRTYAIVGRFGEQLYKYYYHVNERTEQLMRLSANGTEHPVALAETKGGDVLVASRAEFDRQRPAIRQAAGLSKDRVAVR